MSQWVAWIAPPAVGAIIGYVTNDIAIKMLFRPLAEKRIFGLRVPFTPGILPRQRHQLADNIGRMVARELITEDIIRERIRRDDFRLTLERSVAEYSSRLLSAPIGKLALAVPAFEETSRADSLGASDIARLLGSLAERFIASPAFTEIVDRAVAAAVATIGQKTITELAGGDRATLVRSISGRVAAVFEATASSSSVVGSLSDSVGNFIGSLAAEGKSIDSVLPDGAAASIARAADAAYPLLIEAALRYLAQREVRSELEAHGRVFLRDTIQRLNVFQRFFLSAAQYDRTLHEQMPQIVDDLISHVAESARGEKGRARFTAAVRDGVERFLSSTVSEASASLGMDSSALAGRIAQVVVKVLSARGTGIAVSHLVTNYVGELVDEPLIRIAERTIGVDTDTLIRTISTAVKGLASADPGPAVARAVDAFLADRGESSISDLLGIDAAGKEKLDRFLADRVLALIDERISAALSTLDVRTLVSARIDSLDMVSVESLVLDILANQLRWINVFGAILGALIGLVQAALSAYL
jgi:uncharacterized membrane protein YheB (UPF0754 family)